MPLDRLANALYLAVERRSIPFYIWFVFSLTPITYKVAVVLFLSAKVCGVSPLVVWVRIVWVAETSVRRLLPRQLPQPVSRLPHGGGVVLRRSRRERLGEQAG